MERYVEQLLSDIKYSTENASFPYVEKSDAEIFWISDDEEDRTAPVRKLEEWTGIYKEQLPPPDRLSDDQVHRLLEALIKMLEAYNWLFVMQITVPERLQYTAIRDNFDQEAKVKMYHMGFFELCKPGTEHKKCALGEYCHCAFFAELFAGMTNEDLTPEEERKMQLDCEITHLQRKYGDEWMKYYPYHLDPEYDDEDGKPYDYGMGDIDDDEDDEDNWWRK